MALSGLHRQAEDFVGVRDRRYDTLMRDVKHLTTGTANDRMKRCSDLVRGWQVHRLHAGSVKRHGLERVSRRRCQRAKYAADPHMTASTVTHQRRFAGWQARPDHSMRAMATTTSIARYCR